MSQNSLATNRMQAILREVAETRWRNYWINIGTILVVLIAASFGGLVAVALSDPANAIENIETLLGCVLFAIIIPFYVIIAPLTQLPIPVFLGMSVTSMFACVMFFVPIVLYFWSQVVDSRRRVLLSLLQTALETGTPLAEMIRTYATTYSGNYGYSLEQLVASLENGHSLPVALSKNPKLVRYDVCGILTLGTDEKQTLKTLEDLSRNTRNRTLTQANCVFRVAYLLAMCLPMFLLVLFIHMWIAPQFEAIFEDFGMSLPPLTRAVFDFGMPVAMLATLFFPFVAIGMFLFLLMQSDVISSRPFGLRRLFRNVDASRFLRIFSTGLKNQVPIPEGLDIYRRVTVSFYSKNVAERINKKIRSGGNWIDAFRKAHIITAGESRLLESAQRTGNLPTVIDQIAESKDLKQSGTSDLVSKFVFIPCMLLIGSLVGLFAVGMFLPLIALILGLS